MEDLGDRISSTGFKPLFIKEEEADPDRTLMEQRECNAAQSGLNFTGTQSNQSALIKPYLQEMDDLLKSCEELTGIPFGSRFSANFSETTLNESTHNHSQEEDSMKSRADKSISASSYLFTSYIDTNMDCAETENHQEQGQSQGTDQINRIGGTADVCCQREMPLTSAGHKLSDTMVEYEGKLFGMLAMLDSSMEEAGMDWASETSQEYVHISQSPKVCASTTPGPIQQGKPMKLQTQPMDLESWFGEDAGRDEFFMESSHEAIGGSATNGRQQNPMGGCDNMYGVSMEQLERQRNSKADEIFHQFGLSKPSIPLVNEENDPNHHEGPKTGDIPTPDGTFTNGDVTGSEVDNTEVPDEEAQEAKMDTLELGSGINDLGIIGSKMEECIQEVQGLEKRRKDLLTEVLKLRGNNDGEEAERNNEEETEQQIDSKVTELTNALKKEEEGRQEERKREIESLRDARAAEERRMWKVNLERQGLQEEIGNLKRRLFAVARDCAHSQFALNTQHREVEVLKQEEEKLQSLVLQLGDEGFQLRSAQQQQLLDLEAQLHAQIISKTSNTQDELTQFKRNSCGDIQQYLQGGLTALENRYEPILLALWKRREATAEAQVKAKEQAQDLKAQMRPLREEIQKLKLQKACLEEKLKLLHIHRREDMGQYKETISFLEESSRELKTELKFQKRKTNEMDELMDSLTTQLLFFRAAIEDHNK